MHHVALEIPLPLLVIRGLLQRHDLGGPRVQVFHEAFDGSPLAGRVTSLENDHDLLPGQFHPVLDLQQFDLQLGFFL